MVSSHDCYVAILRDSASGHLDFNLQVAVTETIIGRAVWTWSVPPYEGYPRSTSFYATRVDSSLFLVCNDRDDFKQTVQDLVPQIGAAIPRVDIPRWDDLGHYKYWVYRPVRKIDIDSEELQKVMPTAKSLRLFVDDVAKTAIIQVDSSEEDVATITKVLPASELLTYTPAPGGVWGAILQLRADPTTTTTMFRIFDYFGFGVVL